MSGQTPSGGTLPVVIAGGGTGGHLYPGIAVAREILRLRPEARVSFAGTRRGLEARIVPQEGFDLDVIRSAGLKGKSLVARARGVLLLAPSGWDAWRLLSRRRPRVVIGVGGYSSGPVVLLAALRGIPTMILEQNAIPGLANRLLAPVVRAAAVTYDDTRRYFGDKAFVSGNPVRGEFFTQSAPARADDRPTVLVLGGSQGAHAINRALMEAAPLWADSTPGVSLVLQAGPRDVDAVRDICSRATSPERPVSIRVEPYLNQVATEMARADVVVCRAGATTLAELAAIGRPAVIVPLPTATDDHQRRNARVLAEAGAAVMIEQRDLTGERLVGVMAELLADQSRRSTMATAMRTFARPDAAASIAQHALELVR